MDAVHPRVLALLGRALSLELSAVQQYMFQASLAASPISTHTRSASA